MQGRRDRPQRRANTGAARKRHGARRGRRTDRDGRTGSEEGEGEEKEIGRRRCAAAGLRSAVPCHAERTRPGRSGWVHEIKFDGYRIQARLDHGEVRLLDAQGARLDRASFPPSRRRLPSCRSSRPCSTAKSCRQASNGISSFSQLQQDLSDGRNDRLVYFAFDLLHLDGRDLTGDPLIERKKVLQALLADCRRDGPVRFSEHFEEPGSVLLEHACQMTLEGHHLQAPRCPLPLRARRRLDQDQVRRPARNSSSPAMRRPPSTPRRSARSSSATTRTASCAMPAAPAPAIPTRWRATCGGGCSRCASPSRRSTSCPKEETAARNAKWVEPRLVVEADFRGWTHGDRIRQASFQGIREDKSPNEVVREDQGHAH